MTTGPVARVVVSLVAAGAVLLPGLLVEMAEDRGGVGEVDTANLFTVSAPLAVFTGVLAWTLFGRGSAMARTRGDLVVAALDGIVAMSSVSVVALVAFLVLHVHEEEALGDGFGVEVFTWTGGHLVAVGVGVLCSRVALLWLAKAPGPA